MEQSKITDELSRKYLDQISSQAYGKPIMEISDEELEMLFLMDSNTIIKKISVYATETRRMEAQYCTNQYSAGMDIDTGAGMEAILDKVKTIKDREKAVSLYLSMKTAYLNLVKVKWHASEQFIRGLLREAEEKDKVAPLGRWT